MKDDIVLQDMKDIYGRNIEWDQFRDKTVLVTGPNGMLASYVMYLLIFLNEEKHFNIHVIAMARSAERFVARFGEYGNARYITLVTDPIHGPIHIDGEGG